jgi:hypothetical protein
MPTAPIPPLPQVPKGWEIDKRQAIGLAIGLLGLGIMIGFRLGAGAEPMIVDRPVDRIVYKPGPCADCDEKAAAPEPAQPQQSVPGDSSVPEDTA